MNIAMDDVWAQADLLVKRHGETAPDEAAQNADRLLDAGAADDGLTWRRIVAASKAVLARDVSTT